MQAVGLWTEINYWLQSCGVAFPQKGESALLAKGPIPSDRSFYTGESLCDGVENYNENLFKIY